jgi:FKBP-type peptidyl-prolyl cis-trans isomerase FkpA
MKKILFGLACLLLLFSCKEKEPQADIDERLIQKHIADNNLNAIGTGSGLYYVIQDSGLAGRPNINSVVSVYYRGELTDGSVFDEQQAPESPLQFPLANLIPGWQEGIPLIGKTGRQTLLIPSSLGYGSRQTGSIPSNSVLIFDIELVDHY